MAKIELNTALGRVRGRIDNLVFRRYGNTTVVYEYNKPKSTKPTIRQMMRREEFIKATEYAKTAMRDPVLKMQYQLKARETGKGNAYNAAMKDFMNKPLIKSMDVFEKGMVIDARDDFRVDRVVVRVLKKDGAIVEEGNAYLSGDGLWHYYFNTNQTGITIKAIAYDVPGNATEMTKSVCQ